MKRTQFAIYIHTDEYGRRRKTTWKMSPDAAAKLTDPEIIPSSIEWRNLPEPGENLYGPSHGFATGPHEDCGHKGD